MLAFVLFALAAFAACSAPAQLPLNAPTPVPAQDAALQYLHSPCECVEPSAAPKAHVCPDGSSSPAQEQAGRTAVVQGTSPSEEHDPLLDPLRAELVRARDARGAADHALARSRIAETITRALRDLEGRQDEAALEFLESAARFASDVGEVAAAGHARRRILEVRESNLPESARQLQSARCNLAGSLDDLGDHEAARALFEKVLEVYSHTLPDDDPELQRARGNVALARQRLGDLAGARELEELVLAHFARTLPADDAELQIARLNLAWTLTWMGELPRAKELEEQALECFTRTRPADDPYLLKAKANLAVTYGKLGDIEREIALEEQVLDARSRTLPEGHQDLQDARANLATSKRRAGDAEGACALLKTVYEVQSRRLPGDHADLQTTRINLASALKASGDLRGARGLEEQVLEVRSRTLPDDDPLLQNARMNLGNTLVALGDLIRGRALEVKALEVRSRTLPDDHPDLQIARSNLAGVLLRLGDIRGARALYEKVLEIRSRSLPDGDLDLQRTRQGLASTLKELGCLEESRRLCEKVLQVLSEKLPDDSPALQKARGNLAATLKQQGDLAGAKELEEKVLEVRTRRLPDDHPDLQLARQNLASTLFSLRDYIGAKGLLEKVLQVCSHSLPGWNPDAQRARQNLASVLLAQQFQPADARERTAPHPRDSDADVERASDLLSQRCWAQAAAARELQLTATAREAEERSSRLASHIDFTLSMVLGYGGLKPMSSLLAPAFANSEATRNAAVAAAASARRAARSVEYSQLRQRLVEASEKIAHMARTGSSAAIRDAVAERESVERSLLACSGESGREPTSGSGIDPVSLGIELGPETVALAYRRFVRSDMNWAVEPEQAGGKAPQETSVESLCVFVLRPAASPAPGAPTATLELINLGPLEPIRDAIRGWREGLGLSAGRGRPVASTPEGSKSRALGNELRRLILDPLLPALRNAQQLVLVPDDLLHLVPIDALPADADGVQLLGDRFVVETRATLGELVYPSTPASGADGLVGIGGVWYGADRGAARGSSAAAIGVTSGKGETPGNLSCETPIERDFQSLPGTLTEIEGVRSVFAMVTHSEQNTTVLSGEKATVQALLETAPRARWLHIATHGWFASESIPSWADPRPIDEQSGLVPRQSPEETVKGLSPMLLCGLALAGANKPEDAAGRAPGLLTADELSALDLSNCELAVLSACDTARGELRRAGQGVASLQMAMQMAGARSVLTSLWSVPDEATKILMLDFYRQLWVEKKPKWQALWEAKKGLRDAKDASGKPKYSTRDWAAWVLTGNPN